MDGCEADRSWKLRAKDEYSTVGIVGSRAFPDRVVVEAYVRALPPGTVVVSGGAEGVDRWAEEAARERGFETLIFNADWEGLGRSAGPIRNEQIVAHSDRLVAFWDGRSRGTLNSIALASERGIPIEVFDPEGRMLDTGRMIGIARERGIFASIEKARRRQ